MTDFPRQQSSFVGCHVVGRPEVGCIISVDETYQPSLFHFYPNGDAVVTLRDYLVVPKEMFSRRQIKAAFKKYRALNP